MPVAVNSSVKKGEVLMDASKMLMLTQAISKLINVLLNAYLLRTVGPSIFAIATRLDFILITILTLARESPRMVLLKYPHRDEHWPAQVLFLSSLVSMIGCVLSLSSVPLFLRITPKELNSEAISLYQWSTVFYCLSALVEILSEPFFIAFMHWGMMKQRLIVETCQALLRSFLLIYFIRSYSVNLQPLSAAIYALGMSQLLSSALLVFTYQLLFIYNHQIIPKIPVSFEIDWATWNLIRSSYRHSILRFIMAQVDTLVMTFTQIPLKTHGIYSITSNYATLILRLVQSPLEEAGFLLFAKAKDREEMAIVFKYIGRVIRFDVWMGVAGVLFGCQYSHWLSSMLMQGDDAILLSNYLRGFCLLIPTMAIAGICDAYVNATVGELGMNRILKMNFALALFNIMASLLLARWSIGIVMAGILTYMIRAFIAICYVIFRPAPGKSFDFIPRKKSLFLALSLAAVCKLVSMVSGSDSKEFISMGLTSAAILLTNIYNNDRQAIPFM